MSQPVVGRIESLHRYPVKSMQGEELDELPLASTGVTGDRAFAVVDRTDGHVASAKHPRKWAKLLQLRARYTDVVGPTPAAGQVLIEFPDGTSLAGDSRRLERELGNFVGRDVALAGGPLPEMTAEALWPDIDGFAPRALIESLSAGRRDGDEPVSDIPVGSTSGAFVDLAPVHVLTRSSLGALASSDPTSTFDVRRYRPNVVLELGGEGFVENEWSGRTLALGRDVELEVTSPTVRCVMTTLAQGDLPQDRNTLKTLARSNRLDVPQFGGMWACLGVYADVTRDGRVRVGDDVRVSSG